MFDSDMNISDDEMDYYYDGNEDDIDTSDPKKTDPENFVYDCLTVNEVKELINASVKSLSDALKITPSVSKVLLLEHKWDVKNIVEKYRDNLYENLLVNLQINSDNEKKVLLCPVCTEMHLFDKFHNLSCAHSFCKNCWSIHFEFQILEGISTQICCMASGCDVLVPEDLVLNLTSCPQIRDKYLQFAFQDYVKSHPELRFCPGTICQTILRSSDTSAKKATCKMCEKSFCFRCGNDYHAPTDCVTVKKWLIKFIDSATANYITVNTKNCPKCDVYIEKNGGCNHMQCFKCKSDWCWKCSGDWKSSHECSRYKDNSNIANESVKVQAIEELKKNLHYYEYWENHSRSLQLEQQTVDRLKSQINEKIMKSENSSTWIDYQYLFVAATLLAKCRHTLLYTCPRAYYMESSSGKDLFEYHQAQLEADIENLSWKIERWETNEHNRGDIENQMDIVEKRRIIFLEDFFPISS